MSSNTRGLIQPNYDLNISDNESDSHSDSEEDVSSNSLSLRLNPASSVTRTKDAGQSVSVRGPLGSLFFARHSLADSFYDLIRVYTEALPKFKKSKVKDPIGFIIARYLACLQERIGDLPERRERRSLPASEATAIVHLKTTKFSAVVKQLQHRWGRPMPDALYVDERINKMLVNLEDAIALRPEVFTRHEPKPRTIVMWDGDKEMIPLPIMGLDFTLSFYFPTLPVNLSFITELYINDWSLTYFPHWIRNMSNLRHLCIDNNRILYLPSWVVHMKSLGFISASSTPCYLSEPTSIVDSQPLPLLSREPSSSRPRLVDLAAARIRDYIDKGGDWTDLQDLPKHLLAKVTSSYPSRSKEVQILLFCGQAAFVVERVSDEALVGTQWSLCRKSRQGRGP